jgi:hypothetical protein
VAARLIAQLADVDLKDRDARGSQGMEAGCGHAPIERGAGRGFVENSELLA